MDDLPWLAAMRTLLEAPAPAVLVTRRQDGSPAASPVWFRFADGGFEVVIARGDVKLRHLARDPHCTLVVFETEPPFRAIQVRGEASLGTRDASDVRLEIACRYLGADRGERFARSPRAEGVVVRLDAGGARPSDLSAILPR